MKWLSHVTTYCGKRSYFTLHIDYMPIEFWPYKMSTSTYILKIMLTKVLSEMSIYELLFEKVPNYNLIRVFRCQCSSYVRAYNNYKLEPRSTECASLGYGMNQKEYICFGKSIRKILVNRHVVSYEECFPFSVCSSCLDKTKGTLYVTTSIIVPILVHVATFLAFEWASISSFVALSNRHIISSHQDENFGSSRKLLHFFVSNITNIMLVVVRN